MKQLQAAFSSVSKSLQPEGAITDELLTAPGLTGGCVDAQSLPCFSFLLVSLCLQISSTVI